MLPGVRIGWMLASNLSNSRDLPGWTVDIAQIHFRFTGVLFITGPALGVLDAGCNLPLQPGSAKVAVLGEHELLKSGN